MLFTPGNKTCYKYIKHVIYTRKYHYWKDKSKIAIEKKYINMFLKIA